jgi:hypothetical protein
MKILEEPAWAADVSPSEAFDASKFDLCGI